ncbi:hypothetical protein PLESTB_001127000 [Pleodorina starrii]|uniref:Uncharacterized protein n=1 Tax=Pleodorina starrii TaxID=330485 RepID=A0A9W6BRK4_9CHLO|nr:hypothetical protein PLESTM_001364600 [Pleodorina starrii]GLC56615.1 hypothetical protein PLESTB_001127000 [Pleodorina starrii]GLC76203.1 hypothetical protein PLESTF_001749200 [Pleodorina starrii]
MSGADGPYNARRQRQLEEQVQILLGEVNALESKLGDLHATDVSSLRRAYKSLAQHVLVLDVETKHLPALLDRSTEPSLTPGFLAQQARLVAAVTAAVVGTGRLLRTLRVEDAGPITAGLTLLGVFFAGVRLAAATVQRLGSAAARRQQAQGELRSDLRAVRERVQVMADLVESGLRLHRMHPSQQSQMALQGQQQPPPQQELLLPPPPPPPLENWGPQQQQQWQYQPQQQQPQQQPFLSFPGGPGGGRPATPPRASAVGDDDGW